MAESAPEKTTFPRGWFAVGYSNEIENGQVEAPYFGTKYVAFRDEEVNWLSWMRTVLTLGPISASVVK